MLPVHDLAHQRRLDQLRQHRNRADPDLSLGFIQKQFRQDVERPHKQLAGLTELWAELVPPALLPHTRLIGLQRGVLRVAVDASPRLYELQALLRAGLEKQLIERHRATLRRVKLQVDGSFQAEGGA